MFSSWCAFSERSRGLVEGESGFPVKMENGNGVSPVLLNGGADPNVGRKESSGAFELRNTEISGLEGGASLGIIPGNPLRSEATIFDNVVDPQGDVEFKHVGNQCALRFNLNDETGSVNPKKATTGKRRSGAKKDRFDYGRRLWFSQDLCSNILNNAAPQKEKADGLNQKGKYSKGIAGKAKCEGKKSEPEKRVWQWLPAADSLLPEPARSSCVPSERKEENPQYCHMKGRLQAAGWKVTDSGYISPSGSAFRSLPVAWEAHIKEISRRGEIESSISYMKAISTEPNDSSLSKVELQSDIGVCNSKTNMITQETSYTFTDSDSQSKCLINTNNDVRSSEVKNETAICKRGKKSLPSVDDKKRKMSNRCPNDTSSHDKYGCSGKQIRNCEETHSNVSGGSSPLVGITEKGNVDMVQPREIELLGSRKSERINGRRVEVYEDPESPSAGFPSPKCIIMGVTNDCGTSATALPLKFQNIEGKMLQLSDSSAQRPEFQQRCERQIALSSYDNKFEKIDREFSFPDKCSPSSLGKKKSTALMSSHDEKEKKRSRGCALIRRLLKVNPSDVLCQRKHTILSWLIDSGFLSENEKVIYRIDNGMTCMLSGWIAREGIRCNCCKKVISLLEFEAHAGSGLRQPWINIYTDSGKSLFACQRVAWEKEKRLRNVGFRIVGVNDADGSDDTCGICADGGDLVCCDNCPSTFHLDCLMIKALPEGTWFCPNCRCAFCTVTEHPNGPANRTLCLCGQCGRKYHKDCIHEHIIHEGTYFDSIPFCGQNCRKVAEGLSNMLGVSKAIEPGLSCTLLKRLDDDNWSSSDQRLASLIECNTKLAVALSVMDECFVPLVDSRTSIDMISQTIYNCGSNYNRLNYQGFYTMILEKDGEIISVASLRLHGTRLAEMPFIGTRPTYRRQGMCRRLLNAIEEMLFVLHVEKLIIPAVPDLLETWKTAFSFKPLESSHKNEIRNLNLMIFADTTLLQKPVFNPAVKYHIRKDHSHAEYFANIVKDIPETHELFNFFEGDMYPENHVVDTGVCRWWDPECNIVKDAYCYNANVGPSKQVSYYKGVNHMFVQPKASSYAYPELLPVQGGSCSQSMNLQLAPYNLEMVPLAFTSFELEQPAASTASDNISVLTNCGPRWLQNGAEAKEVYADAMRSSLPIDSFLSIGI